MFPLLTTLYLTTAPAHAHDRTWHSEWAMGVSGTVDTAVKAKGLGQTWTWSHRRPAGDHLELGLFYRRTGFVGPNWEVDWVEWRVTPSLGITGAWTPSAAERLRVHAFAGGAMLFTFDDHSEEWGLLGGRATWDMGPTRIPPAKDQRTHVVALGFDAFAHLATTENVWNAAAILTLRRRH